jgi:hypothetical protein
METLKVSVVQGRSSVWTLNVVGDRGGVLRAIVMFDVNDNAKAGFRWAEVLTGPAVAGAGQRRRRPRRTSGRTARRKCSSAKRRLDPNDRRGGGAHGTAEARELVYMAPATALAATNPAASTSQTTGWRKNARSTSSPSTWSSDDPHQAATGNLGPCAPLHQLVRSDGRSASAMLGLRRPLRLTEISARAARTTVSARFLSVVRFSGPASRRFRARSPSKPTSRTQCRQNSIRQCAGTAAANATASIATDDK